MQACAALRPDLRVSEQRARGELFYVVKEPVSGRLLRLTELQYFIARQLDGATTLDDVRGRTQQKFGEAPAAGALEGFVGNIRRLGLLEGEAGSMPAQSGRLRGDVLYLRLRAFDPDATLERLLPAVRWCFTPAFVGASAALVVLACLVAAANWPQIRWEASHLWRFEALAYAWLILLLNVSAHEFAHGLTCKHFGGQVREMGFMLIYFNPAFYCNVSDAWLIPEKSRRLWVSFTGAWLDITLWALAVLLWQASDPDTWIHFTALVVAATAGVRTLFNLNPLIKLDGYYLLADWLEIPNLRARALRYMRGRLGRLWSATPPVEGDLPAREKRIFVVYGTVAAVYSSGLLAFVAWWLGGYLVAGFQGLGFVAFVGLLGLMFRRRLKGLWLLIPRRARGGFTWFRNAKPPVKGCALLAAILAPLILYPAMRNVGGEFSVLPNANADVRAEVDGIVETIHVQEGQRVVPGQLVARLSDLDYRAELAQIEAAMREKQARLKMMRAGPRPEDIAPRERKVTTNETTSLHARKRLEEALHLHAARVAAARATASKASEQLQLAEQTLARTRALLDKGFISAAKFQEAEAEASVRRRALEEAQAALAMVTADELASLRRDVAVTHAGWLEAKSELAQTVAGNRVEEIEGVEAEVASLEAKLLRMRDRLERVSIRSPHGGVITTPRPKEIVGRHLQKGDLVVEVHDLDRVLVEVDVPERDIGPVRVGQAVILKAKAYPGQTFHGTVTEVAPAVVAAASPLSTKVVRVRSAIDNPDGLLKTQMTGYAKIECGRYSLLELLWGTLINPFRLQVWSWW